MALLYFAHKSYPKHIALVDDQEELTYKELWLHSEKLAIALKEHYQIREGQKVGLLCRNHASLIKAIFAVSRLGADLYYLNVDMSRDQITSLVDHHRLDLIVHDEGWSPINGLNSKNISSLLQTSNTIKLPRTSKSKLVLDLTKDEILQWLRARVARYQIPKEFIFRDQLPYTPLGKRDKKRLQD